MKDDPEYKGFNSRLHAHAQRVFWVVLALVALCALTGCAALSSVTPADRAQAYAAEARGVSTLCKVYRFDRSVGLVEDVPAMTELCDPVRP